MLRYEWDEPKRRANIRKHGLDFQGAWRVYEHKRKVTLPDEYPDEERWQDLAEAQGIVYLLVYTEFGDTVRCISYRRASRLEAQFYYEQIQGS
jgi:uncharacterized DUF497 family protein